MPDLDFPADCPAPPACATATSTPALVTAAHASVTAEYAKLSRMIGRGCQRLLPGSNPEITLELHMADAETAASFVSSSSSTALSLRGKFGVVHIDDGVRFLRALTGIDLTGEMDADEARWAWIQAVCIGRLAGTPFARTKAISRINEISGAQPADTQAMQLSLRTHGHAVVVRAVADTGTWLSLLAMTEWTPQQARLSEYLDLTVNVPVRIARHSLPARALRSVAAGDIIVPDSPNFKCDGQGSIRLGTRHAQVRYEAPCTLNIIALEDRVETIEQDEDDFADEFDEFNEQNEDDTHGEFDDAMTADAGEGADDESMPDFGSDEDPDADLDTDPDADPDEHEPQAADAPFTAPAPEEDEQPSALDIVPVTLDFVMGKARMQLGALRTLDVGTIVSFEGGSPSSISILSGGRSLGRGELVDVDGELAIRITQWGRK